MLSDLVLFSASCLNSGRPPVERLPGFPVKVFVFQLHLVSLSLCFSVSNLPRNINIKHDGLFLQPTHPHPSTSNNNVDDVVLCDVAVGRRLVSIPTNDPFKDAFHQLCS